MPPAQANRRLLKVEVSAPVLRGKKLRVDGSVLIAGTVKFWRVLSVKGRAL